MRSLEDKRPNKAQSKQKEKEKEGNKSSLKQNIRKTVKTSFKEDFRYEIEVLPHGDSSTVTTLILQYIQLMNQENLPPKTLSRKYIITGINATLRAIKKCQTKFLVFVFFDPKFYDHYEQLLICLLNCKGPLIIMKPNEDQPKIKYSLKVKKLSCLYIEEYDRMPNHLTQFFRFTLNCRVAIPTLYEPSLPPAVMEETTVITTK